MSLKKLLDKYNIIVKYGDNEIGKEDKETEYSYIEVDDDILSSISGAGYDVEDLLEYYNVNLIIQQKVGEIDFVHYTTPEHRSSIEKEGLISNIYFTGDFGEGVYVIDSNDDNAYDNLIRYLCEDGDGKNYTLLEVTGTYRGPYRECIYASEDYDYHVGYIALPSVSPDNLSYKELKMSELYYGEGKGVDSEVFKFC